MKNVLRKLKEVRFELQGLELKKSGANKHLGFNYYELGDFIPKVNELFNEKGLLGQFNITGEMPFGIATLTIYDVESEEKIDFTSPVAQATLKSATPVQELGAVHTYMKRYLYLNALEIVEPDVLDKGLGDSVGGKPTPATKKQVEMITSLLNNNEKHIEYTCTEYKVESLDKLTMQQASEVITRIKEKQGK